MSVWYLHHYAGHPKVGMSFRPYYLARGMQDLDQEVVVFAASFHHLKRNDKKQVKQAIMENVDGVFYCWIKTRAYKGNSLARIVNMFQFALSLLFLNPVTRFNIKNLNILLFLLLIHFIS